MNPFLRSPKSVFITGALTLWVAFPLCLAGLVKVAASVGAHGKIGPLAAAGLLAWGFVCLMLLIVGFVWILTALWMRVRLRSGRGMFTTTRANVARASGAERAKVLAELTKKSD